MNQSRGMGGSGHKQRSFPDSHILYADASVHGSTHCDALQSTFQKVIQVDSIEDAIHILDKDSVDCIITSNNLVDGDAIDLLDAVHCRDSVAPVVLWPASGSEEIASEALRNNASDYVPRQSGASPDYEKLIERIRAVFASPHPLSSANRIGDSVQGLVDLVEIIQDVGSTEEAYRSTLEFLCGDTAWVYGEVWSFDESSTRLERVDAFAPDDRFGEFTEMSDVISFELGEGLPGRVLESGSPERIPDVSVAPATEYIRTAAADGVGFQTAYAIPVNPPDALDTVLVCYSLYELRSDSFDHQLLEATGTLLEEQLSGSGTVITHDLERILSDIDSPNHADSLITTLVDHVDVTLWVATADFDTIVFSSQNFERISGYSKEEFRQQPDRLLDLVHPEDRDRVRQRWETREEPYTFEYRITSAEGETIWIEERGRPVDLAGPEALFVGMALDITDRKAQEQALKRQRELLKQTEELAHTGGWIADLETGNQRWTEGTKAIHGVSSYYDPTINAGIEFFHPDDRDTIDHVFTRCAEHGEPYDVELRIITADDRVRWVRATAEPLYDDGEIRKVCGAIQDITDRKQQEQELRHERENLRQTERLAKAGGWVYDCETEELDLTNGFRRLVDLPVDSEASLAESYQWYHPEDRSDLIDAFERCRDDGVSYELEVRLDSDSDRPQWIHEYGERFAQNGGYVVRGAIRDITDRKRYETTLKELADGTRDLVSDETDAEIANTVVDVGSRILDADGIAVYLYDDTAEQLIPTAWNEGADELFDDLPQFAPGEGVAWNVFVDQEPRYYADVRTADALYRDETPIRSELIQPLGEYGVVLVGDTSIDAFDSLTVEATETLASTAEEALTRAEFVTEIRHREHRYQSQTEELQQVEQLNAQIRSTIKAVVTAGTQESVKQILCDSLASLDEYCGVWIGEPRYTDDAIDVTGSAGSIEQYLESITLDLSDENTLPTSQSLQERRSILEANLAEDPHQDAWRNPALIHGVRSVVSIPIVYEHVLYGALSINSSRPNHFDDRTVSVLEELGELIGYILNTVAQRHAFQTGGMVELTVDVLSDDTFVDLARNLESNIVINHIVEQSAGSYLVYFAMEDVDPSSVVQAVDSNPAIREITPISTDTPATFEVRTVGSCIGTEISGLGAHLQHVSVSEQRCRLKIRVPPDEDIHRIVHHLEDRYEDVDVLAEEKAMRSNLSVNPLLMDEALTDRQQSILRAAYFNGYFEQPRERTGVDIADSLDISQPAFTSRLRAAERNLLSTFFE